jgi:drug/metabolite transporter (DMT)-like permease
MPTLALLLAMILAGSVVPANKAVADLPLFVAACARYWLAGAILVPLAWTAWRRLPALPRRDVLLLLAQGAAGSLGFSVCMLLSLRFTGAAEASIVTGTLPAMVTLLSLLWGERASGRQWVALLVATAGVILLGNGAAPASLLGAVLALLAVLGEAAFITLNRQLTTPLPPVVVAAAMSVLGAVFTLPPALADLAAVPQTPSSAWLAIAYHATGPTVLGFLLWYWGAARVGGVASAPFTAAMPATGALLAWTLFREPVEARQLAGLALVLVALAVPFLPTRQEV